LERFNVSSQPAKNTLTLEDVNAFSETLKSTREAETIRRKHTPRLLATDRGHRRVIWASVAVSMTGPMIALSWLSYRFDEDALMAIICAQLVASSFLLMIGYNMKETARDAFDALLPLWMEELKAVAAREHVEAGADAGTCVTAEQLCDAIDAFRFQAWPGVLFFDPDGHFYRQVVHVLQSRAAPVTLFEERAGVDAALKHVDEVITRGSSYDGSVKKQRWVFWAGLLPADETLVRTHLFSARTREVHTLVHVQTADDLDRLGRNVECFGLHCYVAPLSGDIDAVAGVAAAATDLRRRLQERQVVLIDEAAAWGLGEVVA
jgi:hypothetical protein